MMYELEEEAGQGKRQAGVARSFHGTQLLWHPPLQHTQSYRHRYRWRRYRYRHVTFAKATQ